MTDSRTSKEQLTELRDWLIALVSESGPYDGRMFMLAADVIGEKLADEPTEVLHAPKSWADVASNNAKRATPPPVVTHRRPSLGQSDKWSIPEERDWWRDYALELEKRHEPNESIFGALRDLKDGIARYATDTVWYSSIETACDRIDSIIDIYGRLAPTKSVSMEGEPMGDPNPLDMSEAERDRLFSRIAGETNEILPLCDCTDETGCKELSESEFRCQNEEAEL